MFNFNMQGQGWLLVALLFTGVVYWHEKGKKAEQ